ncbi:MAG: PQQ-dependent sugar dehydrogenase [Pseudomonadota bacterium]
MRPALIMGCASALIALALWNLDGLRLPPAAAATFSTSGGEAEVTRLVSGLDTPWAVAPLPGGGALITERDGRVFSYGPDWRRRAVSGVPAVAAAGQGGLLDVVLARDFAETRTVFLTYSEPASGGAHTAMARATLSQDLGAFEDLRVLFRQTPSLGGRRHFGSRVVERADGTLFITTGDRGDRPRAQDPRQHVGKVIRIARDGSVPADNPFADAAAALPEIWSIGHRNAQGAALDEEGRLWTVSHGARGGDEINRPEPGKNYGWPVISYGEHYAGGRIGEGTAKAGLEQPVHYWDPSIAPSGMMIYSGKLFPEWAGDIFVGSLKFDYIARLDRDGDRILGEERLFEDDYIRIRDIREAPDGSIWFLAVGDGALFRIAPPE